jgi:hypothetical protein
LCNDGTHDGRLRVAGVEGEGAGRLAAVDQAPEPTSCSSVGALTRVQKAEAESHEGKGYGYTTEEDESGAVTNCLAAGVGVIDDALAVQVLTLKRSEVLITVVGDDGRCGEEGLWRVPWVF